MPQVCCLEHDPACSVVQQVDSVLGIKGCEGVIVRCLHTVQAVLKCMLRTSNNNGSKGSGQLC